MNLNKIDYTAEMIFLADSFMEKFERCRNEAILYFCAFIRMDPDVSQGGYKNMVS